jgi:MoaA/NifB/PqqE/SkfB family radical SAM enzyme
MSGAEKPIRTLPQFLYIEPTSVCNLHCKMCYANVINGPQRRVSDAEGVLGFVRRFVAVAPPPVTVYWCGTGEVFLHREFPAMVNHLRAESGDAIQQIIQTNGTVRRLGEFDSLADLEFRISIDGIRPFHEWHRGANTYDRTLDFCREAVERGCRSLTVRTLLTRDNIGHLDALAEELRRRIGPDVRLLVSEPYTNPALRAVRGLAPAISQRDIEDATAISREEARQILHETYQDRYELDEAAAVDNYLSLNTYGVHSCCHGVIRLGDPETEMATLLDRLAASEDQCRACPMYPCQ